MKAARLFLSLVGAVIFAFIAIIFVGLTEAPPIHGLIVVVSMTIVGFIVVAALSKNSLKSADAAIRKAKDRRTTSGKRYRDALALAEEEIKSQNWDKGVWAQALVDANGDENKRKLAYMKLRARELSESRDGCR